MMSFLNIYACSRVDVEEMFPIAKIQSWPTYVYPQNLKSKTLYLIEKK